MPLPHPFEFAGDHGGIATFGAALFEIVSHLRQTFFDGLPCRFVNSRKEVRYGDAEDRLITERDQERRYVAQSFMAGDRPLVGVSQ